MRKVLVIAVIFGLVGVLAWLGYKYGYKKPPTPVTITKTEDLNAQLQQTVDDGGTADFMELQKSAEGL